ncbi:glycosyltransferase [Spiribacter halobius]|uniref:Glycosyl transferase n=1 Tax=Sediminicurvatus halobius TaxID=2182432 RepID=A0A2U2N700_9GAMM|nr:glycosyltransferase [Spiribacter halobius]PWG64900.1 glycosyl transferase [Spiribacter halobius]UEX78245.1 glycosyltransferase [Spiribacter halobius]
MKVVHVEAGRHLYGGALQVVFLLEGLQARGIESVLVCPPGAEVGRRARELGIDVREIPLRGDHDLPFILRLVRLLRRERPDILHLHSRRGADTLGGIVGRLAGVPTVLSRRVDNPEPRWLVAVKYRLYDRVITISEAIRQVLLEEGVRPEKAVCVHSAVDTVRYAPQKHSHALQDALGLSGGGPVIGMIAQLIPRKGHQALLDAAPQVLAAHPQAHFVLFGRGPLHQEIEQAIRARNLQDSVLMAGFRDDLPVLLPELDIVVHPAEMEGLGVSLLQAAACGVPVVASRAGGIPEAVDDSHSGYLVPPGDTKALATAINTLLADASLRQAMAGNARALAMQRFSCAAMVSGNLHEYQRLQAR